MSTQKVKRKLSAILSYIGGRVQTTYGEGVENLIKKYLIRVIER
jgi:hypothetical protein